MMPSLKRLAVFFISKSKNTKGFTFVEIMIVIAIMGLLAVLVAGNYLQAKQRGRDGKRKSDLSLIQAAFEQYKADYNTYPCFGASDCPPPASHEYWNIISTMDKTHLPSKYLNDVPKDPLYSDPVCSSSSPEYLYWHDTTLQQYAIFANLENTSDSDALSNKPAPPNGTLGTGGGCIAVGSAPCAKFKITSGICNGTTYNYWVFSP